MRYYTTLILAGLLLMTGIFPALAAAPADSGAVTAPSDPPLISRLSNGLTVAIKKDDRFPLVSLRLYVHAGSAYENKDNAGISHLLEHMVFKGTEQRPKGQVASDVESTGGYLNAATSFDYTVYLTDMTAEHWKTGLDVLKDMAFYPSLDPQELESEKEVVIAELKRGEDNPGQRVFRIIQGMALAGTPYKTPIIGHEKTIRAITAQDMRAYISQFYQPQSMLLVICGNVDVFEARRQAEALFGGLVNTRSVEPPQPAVPSGISVDARSAQVIEEKGPWQKAHIALALPGPSLEDARAPQLDVLAQLLGGDATSRFYRTYKYEKRLVDSISVSNYSFERLGLIFIRATLDADKVEAFVREFSRELAALGSVSFTPEELDRAKLNLEDDLLRSKETISGLTDKLGYFQFFGNGAQFEDNYLRSVKETDQAVLSGLIAETFAPDKLSVAMLLPKDAAPPAGSATFADFVRSTLNTEWKVPQRPETAGAAASRAVAPEVVDLGQGRTVILQHDTTLPYVAANLLFTGGDALLAPKDQGLGTFSAALLNKGTQKLNANQVEDYKSDRASSLGASSGRQSFSLSFNGPARFTNDLFALLHDTIASPAMLEEEAARVRENQTAAITAREDQPTSLAFRKLFPFLFQNHPYGYMSLGEKDRVAAFTPADAKAFWKQQQEQPWVLSVCGDFDKAAILEQAKKLPVPSARGTVIKAPGWNKQRELDLTLKDRNQAHLFMVFPAVGSGHPDEAGLDLLQNILAGQSGLLFSDLRDKQGLGYTVTAMSWKTQMTGAMIFYIGTDPDKMEQAHNGFLSVINDLHNAPLPSEQLDRGKNQMKGDYYRGNQTLSARSSEAAVLSILGMPLDSARALVDKAGTLTAQDVQKLAKTYIQPDKAYIVKVLP